LVRDYNQVRSAQKVLFIPCTVTLCAECYRFFVFFFQYDSKWADIARGAPFARDCFAVPLQRSLVKRIRLAANVDGMTLCGISFSKQPKIGAVFRIFFFFFFFFFFFVVFLNTLSHHFPGALSLECLHNGRAQHLQQLCTALWRSVRRDNARADGAASVSVRNRLFITQLYESRGDSLAQEFDFLLQASFSVPLRAMIMSRDPDASSATATDMAVDSAVAADTQPAASSSAGSSSATATATAAAAASPATVIEFRGSYIERLVQFVSGAAHRSLAAIEADKQADTAASKTRSSNHGGVPTLDLYAEHEPSVVVLLAVQRGLMLDVSERVLDQEQQQHLPENVAPWTAEEAAARTAALDAALKLLRDYTAALTAATRGVIERAVGIVAARPDADDAVGAALSRSLVHMLLRPFATTLDAIASVAQADSKQVAASGAAADLSIHELVREFAERGMAPDVLQIGRRLGRHRVERQREAARQAALSARLSDAVGGVASLAAFPAPAATTALSGVAVTTVRTSSNDGSSAATTTAATSSSTTDNVAALGGSSLGLHTLHDSREQADRLLGSECLRMIESPHPYLPNTDEEIVVSMPGATFLTLTFDDRCNTEQERDFVGVYRGRGRSGDSILPLLSGRHEHWPRVPVVCQGDTVTISFRSDPFQTFWGYRIVVRAHLMPNLQWHWLVDAQSSLADIAVAAAEKLTRVSAEPLPDDERAKHAGWLDDAALAAWPGATLTPPDETGRFLLALAGDTSVQAASGAALLAELQRTARATAFDRLGGEPVSLALRSVFATVVARVGLTSSATECGDALVAGATAPADTMAELRALWASVTQMRAWVVREQQMLLDVRELQTSAARANGGDEAAAAAAVAAAGEGGAADRVPLPYLPEGNLYEFIAQALLDKLRPALASGASAAAASAPSTAAGRAQAAAKLLTLLQRVMAVPAAQFEALLKRRSERAEHRAEVLAALADSIGTCREPFAVHRCLDAALSLVRVLVARRRVDQRRVARRVGAAASGV
jgi:hypothetical protein